MKQKQDKIKKKSKKITVTLKFDIYQSLVKQANSAGLPLATYIKTKLN